MIKFISVHIPKSGGTTFLTILKNFYKVYYTVDEVEELNRAVNLNNTYEVNRLLSLWTNRREAQLLEIEQHKYDCIHGHFDPQVYSLVFPKAKWVVWLRDPYKRLISRFLHDHKSMDSLFECYGMDLLKGFEDVIRNPYYRNFTSFYYKRISKLFFVGITEYFQRDMELLANLLQWDLTNIDITKTENKSQCHGVREMLLDCRKRFQPLMEKYHGEDLRLYQSQKERI